MSDDTKMEMMTMSEAERMEFFQAYQENVNATYEDNIAKIGLSSLARPSAISIYPIDFESKDEIVSFIDGYNKKVEAAGNEDKVIEYSDIMGMLMKSVTSMINSVTSLLVGFIAISLLVSSIMIGIITYISVLERRKEIGILRSIGASKGNISSVFNAETLITGLVSGVFGIGATLILDEIISAIVLDRMDIERIATLPLEYGGILILVSMFLTFIAGLIPSRIAASKDPAIALRTE
jgi:putative ABC transport system permease protein